MLVAILLAPGVLRVGPGTAPTGTVWAQDDNVCDIRTSERVVAIGDVHGAFDRFTAILRAAELVNDRNRWTGGRAVLVQTGDVLDRGADSRQVMDLLRRLERDASRAGGRVIALLGNHELMRLVSDWRYVSEGEYAAFRTRDSEDLRERVLAAAAEREAQRARAEGRPYDASASREQFLRDVPLGMIEMRQAFGADGDYGRWLRGRPVVARVNGVLYLHGGISPEVAPAGCAGVNAAVRAELAALPPPEGVPALLAARETGPLWYRGLATQPEESLAAMLDGILDGMQARAIVIGHTTTPGRIAARADGRVIQIDTGMLGGEFYPGGAPSALEIRGDSVAAVYVDRREPLAVPALLEPAPTGQK